MNTTQNKLAEALRKIEFRGQQLNDHEEIAEGSDFWEAFDEARHALAEHDAAKAGFTVFIQDDDGTGTTYITHVEAADIEAAKSAALVECAEAWGYEDDDETRAVDLLRVVGVAAGDVTICEWDDCE